MQRSLSLSRRLFSTASKDKVVVTCSINGVLTDPTKFKQVPVTPDEMATSCLEAFNAGASVAHIHFRDQRENKGHFPTWDPQVAADISAAIPNILIVLVLLLVFRLS